MPSIQNSSQNPALPSSPDQHHSGAQVSFDLGILPPIFVSLSNFSKDAAEILEDRLSDHGANLTYDMSEVGIVLTKVERKRRALFDLRGHGLRLEEVVPPTANADRQHAREDGRAAKRRRLEDASLAEKKASQATTDSETEDELIEVVASDVMASAGPVQTVSFSDPVLERLRSSTVKVIRVPWIESCLSSGLLQPPGENLLLEGLRVAEKPNDLPPTPQTPPNRQRDISSGVRKTPDSSTPKAIMARARADAQETSPRRERDYGSRRFGDKKRSNVTAPYAAGATSSQKPVHFLQETTSEHEGDVPDSELPPQPDWVIKQLPYACQRSTPDNSPNTDFLDLLKEIRLARLLTADEIGVRAYSTSIAAIAAYPHKLRSPKEILHLPGCDVKIANLFVEFSNTGQLEAATAARTDPELTVLRLFFDIWGVGATTARDFLHTRGWRDLDDIVEFGWSTLSRVQQIGVKFYDEFKLTIPRAEVESIAAVIHSHAVKVRDGRVQSLLVGGYRRGKAESGDVDIVLSHPDEAATKDLVTAVVASLEDEGWITHTLLLALTSTHRDQQTLPFRSTRGANAGAGFDTLDKALVVWQDPAWPGREADVARDPAAKNPAPHRRVDIIVAPWRTVGCAVAGWSGGTTFQRDLRRYAKNVRGWKFDSSGVRERGSGRVVDVEGYYSGGGAGDADEGRGVVGLGLWKHRARTMEEAERRVFEGFGLEWRDPTERCTG